MISRLLISFLKARPVSNFFPNAEPVSFRKGRDFSFGFGVSALKARRFSTDLAALPATDANAPDDAVLEPWRKELGTLPAHSGNRGEMSFLLLKNLLYWGSVALSLYLIFTVFSFF